MDAAHFVTPASDASGPALRAAQNHDANRTRIAASGRTRPDSERRAPDGVAAGQRALSLITSAEAWDSNPRTACTVSGFQDRDTYANSCARACRVKVGAVTSP